MDPLILQIAAVAGGLWVLDWGRARVAAAVAARRAAAPPRGAAPAWHTTLAGVVDRQTAADLAITALQADQRRQDTEHARLTGLVEGVTAMHATIQRTQGEMSGQLRDISGKLDGVLTREQMRAIVRESQPGGSSTLNVGGLSTGGGGATVSSGAGGTLQDQRPARRRVRKEGVP